MRCPFCGEQEDKVIDSRPSRAGSEVRRRRECLACGKRYTTYEYVEEISLQVVKYDGSVEPYDRNKLIAGIRAATTKRPVSTEIIDNLISDIEEKLYSKASKEIKTKVIGDLVMKKLRKIDTVAYIRFASVYRRFEDAGEFTEEVRKLK
ncbi:MAG: transcriptional regulator NrdR [Candidatus Electryonea clarkiae]|nr:transcriptional regulator NrdR [Candidatus Electryonea clarkiae]MDP8287245.1 transcriptional regulator NrdR [Candidatus Electryonea clarkiae]